MDKLTINDIAKLAGVSPATVSLVMNQRKGISESTRERVLSVIEETGFKPNAHTRRLTLKKSFTVNIVMRQRSCALFNFFCMELLMGMFHEARRLGYIINFSTVDANNDYSQILDAVSTGASDGAIFIQSYEPTVISTLKKDNFPFICVDSHLKEDGNVPCLDVDYYHAAYYATEYLISRGHRSIAFISSDDSSEYFMRNFTGYTDALKDHELVCRPEWIQKDADPEVPTPSCMDNLLSCKHRPTAVFCTGDMLAVEAINRIHKAGLRIPEDISVIGLDDLIVSEYLNPPLTTMTVDKTQMGIDAMNILYRIINNQPYEQFNMVGADIIERSSVRNLSLQQ